MMRRAAAAVAAAARSAASEACCGKDIAVAGSRSMASKSRGTASKPRAKSAKPRTKSSSTSKPKVATATAKPAGETATSSGGGGGLPVGQMLTAVALSTVAMGTTMYMGGGDDVMKPKALPFRGTEQPDAAVVSTGDDAALTGEVTDAPAAGEGMGGVDAPAAAAQADEEEREARTMLSNLLKKIHRPSSSEETDTPAAEASASEVDLPATDAAKERADASDAATHQEGRDERKARTTLSNFLHKLRGPIASIASKLGEKKVATTDTVAAAEAAVEATVAAAKDAAATAEAAATEAVEAARTATLEASEAAEVAEVAAREGAALGGASREAAEEAHAAKGSTGAVATPAAAATTSLPSDRVAEAKALLFEAESELLKAAPTTSLRSDRVAGAKALLSEAESTLRRVAPTTLMPADRVADAKALLSRAESAMLKARMEDLLLVAEATLSPGGDSDGPRSSGDAPAAADADGLAAGEARLRSSEFHAVKAALEEMRRQHEEKQNQMDASIEAAKERERAAVDEMTARVEAAEKNERAAVDELTSRVEAAKNREQAILTKAREVLRDAAIKNKETVDRATADKRVAEMAAQATTERLEALEKALVLRQADGQRERRAHAVHAGVHALNLALERGAALDHEVAALRAASKAPYEDDKPDAVVVVASDSLPSSALEAGLPTRGELNKQFDDASGIARRLAAVPAFGGGPVAYAMAGLAAWLKFDEEVDTSGPVCVRPTPEQTVARARAALAKGDLQDAADLFEEGFRGTAGAEEAARWADVARRRAVAEQALEFMRAHAATLACAKGAHDILFSSHASRLRALSPPCLAQVRTPAVCAKVRSFRKPVRGDAARSALVGKNVHGVPVRRQDKGLQSRTRRRGDCEYSRARGQCAEAHRDSLLGHRIVRGGFSSAIEEPPDTVLGVDAPFDHTNRSPAMIFRVALSCSVAVVVSSERCTMERSRFGATRGASTPWSASEGAARSTKRLSLPQWRASSHVVEFTRYMCALSSLASTGYLLRRMPTTSITVFPAAMSVLATAPDFAPSKHMRTNGDGTHSEAFL